MTDDPSNGYEAIADTFVNVRSDVGGAFVGQWAKALPERTTVLDLGCGSGQPITAALVAAGLEVSAIDASPSMVQAFRENFPGIEVRCEVAETSTFFGKRFGAVVAVGLLFLLPPEQQRALLARLTTALEPQGRLLFSAPVETGSWEDLLTKRTSWSLGEDAYREALQRAGFDRVESLKDEGGNHFYEAHLSSQSRDEP